MIRNIPFLSSAIEAIRYHHERWDGKGYPEGISGDSIPKLARILSVADSFDALTSKRIYRQAFTPEQAYQEIIRGRGTQYDPHVVDAFCSIWGRLLDLMHKSTY